MSSIEDAVNFGEALARKVFEKRGNHSEMHCSEMELAALLILAYQAGEAHARAQERV